MTQSAPSAAAALPPALLQQVSEQSSRPVAPQFMLLAEELQHRFADSLLGIILYGSCLQRQQPDEGVVDYYVIVRDYRSAYAEWHLRLFNRWLPPNVFYMELPAGETVLRAKYAVISLEALARGCRDWFHPYLWARFAQPARVIYAVDAAARQDLVTVLAAAVVTFLKQGVQAMEPGVMDTEELWARSLGLTYAAELRAETGERARSLARLNLDDYQRLTTAALPALGDLLEPAGEAGFRCHAGPSERRRARLRWRLRRWQGRVLSVLRLTKAVFTFNNAVDYAVWKIQRHTGVSIEVTPRLRRHPILLGFVVLWRLLRRGVLR